MKELTKEQIEVLDNYILEFKKVVIKIEEFKNKYAHKISEMVENEDIEEEVINYLNSNNEASKLEKRWIEAIS